MDNVNNMQAHSEILDLVIVGGGINGAGIAVDAAGRGLHYLEHYEFRLVSEALAEREVILRKVPHIVKAMRFRLPHRTFLRPAILIRMGLFIYDYLAKRTTLATSCSIDLAKSGLLKASIKKGAEVKSYCKVEKAIRKNGISLFLILKLT